MKNKKKNNIIDFPTTPTKLERQVEAILFAASEPLDIETIERRVQTSSNLKKILENLRAIYRKRGINLVCIKNKWSFRTAEDLSKLMALQKSTQKKLSKATIETLAKAIMELFPKVKTGIKLIGTRHGEKLYETLCTREEMLTAQDLGGFYRVPADNRDLNYKKYFEEGFDYSTISDYNSHNTNRLNVDETKELLKSIKFIQESLNN